MWQIVAERKASFRILLPAVISHKPQGGTDTSNISSKWIVVRQTTKDCAGMNALSTLRNSVGYTYPYLRGVGSSSYSGLSVACVSGPHVRRTRRFAQIVGQLTRTPVCADKTGTVRRIRSARNRTPVGDESSSKRCASASVCSLLRYRATSAR